MESSVATTIQLDQEIRNQLKQLAMVLCREESWIITKALQEYLIKEARRQSLLAGKFDNKCDDVWEQNIDTSGWE